MWGPRKESVRVGGGREPAEVCGTRHKCGVGTGGEKANLSQGTEASFRQLRVCFPILLPIFFHGIGGPVTCYMTQKGTKIFNSSSKPFQQTPILNPTLHCWLLRYMVPPCPRTFWILAKQIILLVSFYFLFTNSLRY